MTWWKRMSLGQPWPLLLSLLFLAVTATHAVVGTDVWRKTRILTIKLDMTTHRATSLQTVSGTVCAIMASKTPWSSLFTFEESTCTLWNLTVSPNSDDSPYGPTTEVWTNVETGEN